MKRPREQEGEAEVGGGGCRRKGTEERLQQEIGIDCGSVHLHTNSGVKGEACTEECPTE